jgi:hypothetical protein
MNGRIGLVLGILATALLLAGRLPAQICPSSLSCSASPAVFTAANTDATGQTFGVKGTTASSAAGAAGIWGIDGTGTVCQSPAVSAGVRGESWGGTGVMGLSSAPTGTTSGVGAGVSGYAMSRICIAGVNSFGQLGVLRTVSGTAQYYGVYSGGNMYANGSITASGTKSFVEPHPADPSKEIRYVSLEGPEAGTYFRGSAATVHGFATIEVPESFRLVTDDKGLTVVVTPIGELAMIAVVKQDLNRIVVQSSKDVQFHYLVNGIRRAFKDFEPIGENVDFVPEGPEDGRFIFLPAESQRRLIATGIYTPDGKVNLVKAHEMGWDQYWRQPNAAAVQPPTSEPNGRR